MKNKMILFLVLVLLFLALPINAIKQTGEVKAFHDGNRYLELTEIQKLSYVGGLMDMLFEISQKESPEYYADLVLKTEGMKQRQLMSIYDKFLEEHPEDWHFSAAYLFDFAIREIVYE